MKRQAYNPYLPGWEYIPDGEPRVFGGRLYIFGSHDRFGGKTYCENDYAAWSAPVEDLSDWRYEGIIYRREQTPWNTDRKPYYAPDVVQGADGRFYLYYFVANTSIISVAVCEQPAGKYEYLGDVVMPDGHPYGSGRDDWFTFDPGVLVDDDGRIYLYTGSGQPSNRRFGHEIKGCFVLELEPDMRTVRSGPTVVLPADWSYRKPSFFEGASIRHIGDYYYLIYPATNLTGLNYAISRWPDRGFVHQGAIHSTSDIGYKGRKIWKPLYPIGNNHGSLALVNGQWYIFDHRMTNGNVFTRQGVAEPVTIGKDGRIEMVESTSCGLNVRPLRGKGTYPAYIACNLIGKSLPGMYSLLRAPFVTQDAPDYEPEYSGEKEINAVSEQGKAPCSYVKNIRGGSQVGYKYFDMTETGRVKLCLRGSAGRLQILTDIDGDVAAEEKFTGSDTWSWVSLRIDPRMLADCGSGRDVGRLPLVIRYKGRGAVELLEFCLE